MFATAVRFFAKKAKGKKKPANMNIGLEGEQWSGTLREIVKEKGPLTVSSFWEHAQTTGIRSKRHMKIILKWMRGQNHVKLVCNHIGEPRSPTEKQFLYSYVVPRSERVPRANKETDAAADENYIPSAGDDRPPSFEDQSPRSL